MAFSPEAQKHPDWKLWGIERYQNKYISLALSLKFRRVGWIVSVFTVQDACLLLGKTWILKQTCLWHNNKVVHTNQLLLFPLQLGKGNFFLPFLLTFSAGISTHSWVDNKNKPIDIHRMLLLSPKWWKHCYTIVPQTLLDLLCHHIHTKEVEFMS